MTATSPETCSAIAVLTGILPGAVGGVCNVLVGYPIDLVKVRRQTAILLSSAMAAPNAPVSDPLSRASGSTNTMMMTRAMTTTTAALSSATGALSTSTTASSALSSSPSVFTMLRNIVLYEGGVSGLYAGVTAPLMAVVPAFAISFASFEYIKKLQLQYNQRRFLQQQQSTSSSTKFSYSPYELSLAQVSFAGGFSGISNGLILGPMERIKCLMQVERVTLSMRGHSGPLPSISVLGCLRRVLHEGGWRGLTKGTGLTILRDIPGNAAYFGTYEATRRFLLTVTTPSLSSDGREARLSPIWTMLAGGMAGIGNWVVAIPVDVIKSRWQTAPTGTYRSVGHVVTVLLRHEGPLALYKGLVPAVLRACPANAACFLGFETTKKTLDWLQQPA